MMKNISVWLPWVAFIVVYGLSAISSYYHYAQKADPTMAEKIKHIGELATWAVSYQSKFTDKSGTDKFQDAVNSVMEQMPNDVTRDTIKGAVEHAYMTMEDGGNHNA